MQPRNQYDISSKVCVISWRLSALIGFQQRRLAPPRSQIRRRVNPVQRVLGQLHAPWTDILNCKERCEFSAETANSRATELFGFVDVWEHARLVVGSVTTHRSPCRDLKEATQAIGMRPCCGSCCVTVYRLLMDRLVNEK